MTEYDKDAEPGAEPADGDGVLADLGARKASAGRRRARSGRLPGILAVLVALAVVVAIGGGLYLGVSNLGGLLKNKLSSADDYPGPGKGQVDFQVRTGDTATEIARALKQKGVVASVDAFVSAAQANPDSSSIQVGTYPLKKQMRAADALGVLVDPSRIVKISVTIPEGLRVVDIVASLADKTDFTKAQFQKVLAQPDSIGLPAYADGNAEGYLFPATYDFAPKAKPVDILTAMVDRWQQAVDDAGLEDAASRLGHTPAELMIVASLVQAEGRGDDMPKIARVIYNRLDNPGNGVTNGLLQIDASVNYGADHTLGAVPTTADIEADTPYNTYTRTGLPPTPIEAPGDSAIAAAANPDDGNWLFYVTVNLATGETKFTDSYQEFLGFRAELNQYCATESAGAC